MSILDAIIQGIVQGLTEFLPVSSSGHLLISQHILGVKENNLFFSIMLHIGTLIAVLAVYYKTILKLIKSFFEIIKDIFTGKFDFKKLDNDKNMVLMLMAGLLPLFLLFVPIPGSNTNVKGIAEELAGDKSIILVGIALIVTSILLKTGINARQTYKINYTFDREKPWEGRKRLNLMDALSIGVTQFVAAIFPGISRSGSTLSTGLLRGINKQTALDYS